LLDEEKRELALYRLEMAKERLETAKILLDMGKLKDSAGRSYYAIFTAARALLAVDGVDFAKHSGVISYFQRQYIKTGVFDVKLSKYISKAFQVRNNSDYADFYTVSRSDAALQYERAVEFYETIEKYLQNQLNRI